MRAASNKHPVPVFQLKASVMGISPPVWGRFLIRGDSTLRELHLALQCMMGWYDDHLHAFDIHGTRYGLPDPELKMRNENRVKLVRVMPGIGGEILYEYDFGDSWMVRIKVEKATMAEERQYPSCIKGKRAGPLEDSGGVYGYSELVQILKDPGHPEYEEMSEWAGEDFDPESFDIDTVNECLARIKKK